MSFFSPYCCSIGFNTVVLTDTTYPPKLVILKVMGRGSLKAFIKASHSSSGTKPSSYNTHHLRKGIFIVKTKQVYEPLIMTYGIFSQYVIHVLIVNQLMYSAFLSIDEKTIMQDFTFDGRHICILRESRNSIQKV